MSTKREQLAGLIAMGEKCDDYPACIDQYDNLCFDARRMEYVGTDEDGGPIADVIGGPESWCEEERNFAVAAMDARATLRLVAEIVEAAGEVRRVAKLIDKLDNLADAYSQDAQEDQEYTEAYKAESAAAIALDALLAKLDEQGGA